MTDTIERKALALVNEVRAERNYGPEGWYDGWRNDDYQCEALCRAIERHEQFAQEVSDVCKGLLACTNANKRYGASLVLNRFIIAKPDPLVEAMIECGFGDSSNAADDIRAALAARGLEITEKKP